VATGDSPVKTGKSLTIFLRSFTLITNFSPDHTSFTAHTFTSTSPTSNPIFRTSFSLRSVATPEAFFGQLTHNIPAGASCLA